MRTCVVVSFIFPKCSGLTVWESKIQSRRKWSNCSSFLGRPRTAAPAMPSHRVLYGPTDATVASTGVKVPLYGHYINLSINALFSWLWVSIRWWWLRGKREENDRKNNGQLCHWEENPPFVILHIRRSPHLTGSMNKECFSHRNVSELKSSLGNSSSDYINYFAEGGERWARGPEEVTAVPKLLLKITEPAQLHSWILPRLKYNSLASSFPS